MALADYAARYAFALSNSFQQRVGLAMAKQALVVQAEASTTPNHAARVTLAKSALASNGPLQVSFAIAVLTDLGFDDTSPDAGLQNEIATLWNSFI